MPRSPHDPVIRDSQSTMWAVFREGLYNSEEVTASGHWHPSRVPSRENSRAWSQRMQASTPYGRQQQPWRGTLSIVPPSPTEPPTPSPPAPPRRTPLAEVRGADVNVLQVELAKDDRKRAARDAAMLKIQEGMRELELAQGM